jgi:hypothetical protein
MKVIMVANKLSYEDWLRKSSNKDWVKVGNQFSNLEKLRNNAKNKLFDICEYIGMPFLQRDLEDIVDQAIDEAEDLGEDIHEDAIEIHQDLYEIRNKYNLSDAKFMIIWRFFRALMGFMGIVL